MGVRVKIFYPELRRLVGDSGEVRAEGETVGECLRDLAAGHAGVAALLFDGRGRLLPPVYVFVNIEGMHKADLAKEVGDGDELILAFLATGG
jgi:hypothetical protein